MKHLLLLFILLSSIVSPLAAADNQDASSRITSVSGRYSLPIPEGWVASLTSLPNLPIAIPSETINLASSTEVFDTMNTDLPFGGIEEMLGNLNGAVIYGTAYPRALLRRAGADRRTFEDTPIFSQVGNVNATAFEHPNLTSGFLRKASTATYSIFLLTALDEAGNLYVINGLSDEAHAPIIEQVLSEIEVQSFDITTLYDPQETTPLTLHPSQMVIDLPQGWWVIQQDDTYEFVPDYQMNLFNGLAQRDLSSTTGMLVDIVQLDLEAFQGAAISDALQGSSGIGFVEALNLEEIPSLSDLMTNPNAIPWSNEQGVTGVLMKDVPLFENALGLVLWVELEDQLVIVTLVGTSDQWEIYRSITETMLQTIRLAE